MRLLLAVALFLHSLVAGADSGAFLESYCLNCHDSDAKKGDLDLSCFTNDDAVMRDRAIWRSVFEKIESHQMPPPKQKSQPTDAQRQELMTWIMDIAARPDPVLGAADPGKPALRRLTRLEYNNTICDLFGLDIDVFIFPERLPISDKSYYQPASGKMGDTVKVPLREYGGKYQVLCRQLGLPGDNRAEHGYRNRGDAMDFSPLLLEKYLAAANEIVNTPELSARSAIFAELLGVKQTLLLYSMMLHCVAFICKALQHKGSAMIARCAQLHPVGLNCTFSGRDCIKWLYKTGDLIRQGSRAFSAIRPVPRQQCLAA